MTAVALTVNGRPVSADVEPRTSLADFLRGHENLTGTHTACEHGVCGACNVLINGVPARSCIAFAVAHDGADVRTVEGFDDDAVMASVRSAFHQEHALQCGYCTPGMLVTARDIVTRFAAADEKQIRSELAGNLCRCTGYQGIVNAIQRVMRELPADKRVGKAAAVNAPPAHASAFRTFTPQPDKAAPAAPAARAASAAAAAEPAPPEKGWTRITDTLVVTRPRPEVWQAFGDTPRMARCIPGVEVTTEDGRHLKAAMRIAFGPIKANFTGDATVDRDDAAMVGSLQGTASDARGGSRTRGRVSYRLSDEPGGAATRVDVTLDFQILGPLAQFSRSGLVNDFARRLMAEFARNLSNDLSGKGPAAGQPASFDASSAFWSVLWGRIKRLFGG